MDRAKADPDDIGAWKLLIKTWFPNQAAVMDEMDVVTLLSDILDTEEENGMKSRGPDLARFMVRLSNNKSIYIYVNSLCI